MIDHEEEPRKSKWNISSSEREINMIHICDLLKTVVFLATISTIICYLMFLIYSYNIETFKDGYVQSVVTSNTISQVIWVKPTR